MKILLLLLVAAIGFADEPIYITVGEIRCGAVRREINKIQVWCWEDLAYTESTSIMNAIITVKNVSIVSIGVESKGTVVFKFLNIQNTLNFEATRNDGSIYIGTFK